MAEGLMAHGLTLRDALDDPLLTAMQFLNDVVSTFPHAISFAPGRPLESCFGVRESLAAFDAYLEATLERTGEHRDALLARLGQYGPTHGIIRDAVVQHLRADEGIDVAPEAVLVTVGAQEAMAIAVCGLFDPRRDILLVTDPAYVGITGVARLLGVTVVGVPSTERGVDPDAVERAIVDASRHGRVRALYDVPDFNNPLGSCLPLAARTALLDVCRRHAILLIEDNAYGMFAYDAPRLPTCKALDRDARVVYIGTFAKTLFPGLRLGYLVADQQVEGRGTLAEALARVKGALTVNTPSITQAIAAGVLLEHHGSLESRVAAPRQQYKRQRDAMAAALDETFDALPGVSWTIPGGGFFLPVSLPFEFGAAELERCSRDYGVIVCPMSFFSLAGGRRHQIRLSFSSAAPDTIAEGVSRLGRFVRDELRERGPLARRPAALA